MGRSGGRPAGALLPAGSHEPLGDMRRRDRALGREAAEELLSRAPVGRLATAAGGRPYVVPLSFVYLGGRIYFPSHPQGRKMAAIRANPSVCFEVDELLEVVPAARGCGMGLRYRSAIAFGRARVVDSPELKLAALKALVRKYAAGPGDAGGLGWPAGRPAAGREPAEPTSADLAGVEVVEIEVDQLTAKEGK